jgi:hypothetical protein
MRIFASLHLLTLQREMHHVHEIDPTRASFSFLNSWNLESV